MGWKWIVENWANTQKNSHGLADDVVVMMFQKTFVKLYTVRKELSFGLAICYLSDKWVNILHAWMVN